LRLTFFNTKHYLQSIFSNDKTGHNSTAQLKVGGQILALRNLDILNKLYCIESIKIPDKFPEIANLIEVNFPSIGVELFDDDYYDYVLSKNNIFGPSERSSCFQIDSNGGPIDNTIVICRKAEEKGSIQLPLNSVLWHSKEEADTILYASLIIYPWSFLNVLQKVLYKELRQTKISPKALVSKSSIIDGPCIIEDNVVIDDYCKIVGPSYIGKGSFIGMNSLVRNCEIGEETKIGFGCELARSYFAGHDKISHQNVILDSIIGANVWFGGYTGTTNVLPDRKNIKYKIDDGLVDTGIDHFGAVVGNDCAVGASVTILPGTQILPNSIVQAGTTIGLDLYWKDKAVCSRL
jgi:UDP-N-acetylglucosamine diphosphorylase / glucose-1-phosphate thymidylyltransferase / UDP-N-acetylgalactosamine diphosphorylase / glucosamine-1-phosphate N-acetyltransferase / galactosamine-1-phosphate N-acetyltransferase